MINYTDLRDKLAFIIFYIENLWDDDLDYSEEQLKEYYDKWVKDFLPSINEKHFGDCTNAPMTCMRCVLDEFYNHVDNLINFLVTNSP